MSKVRVNLTDYGIALSAIAITLLARWLLQPALQHSVPYLMFVLPVSLSAWYGGLRPGLFATLLSAAVADFFFVQPSLSLKLNSGVDAIHFVLFLFVGGLISLGLGLAIVRHLVELHGGTVEAGSAGGNQGAVFTVKLPLLSERISEHVIDDTRKLEPVTIPNALPPEFSSLLEGLRLLVVDDETGSRDLLETLLGHCGAEVRAASCSAQALEEVTHLKPDLLISDIEMPDEDGYSLLRKLRFIEEDLGGRIPAVALTAHARTEDRLQAG